MNHFRLDSLRKQLKPFRLYFFTRLRSTNDHAVSLRRAGRLYCPAIVLAGRQIAGRGRSGNAWWSGPGSITVTFAIPSDDRIAPHRVPLIAGLAVHRALRELITPTPAGSDLSPQVSAYSGIQLKWPNDIWHDGLKLAGLLCERIDGADLIGLGLNVNVDIDDIPSSLRHRVTSLRAVVGREISLQTVLTAIAKQLDKLLLKREFGSFGAILPEYNRFHVLAGRRVCVTEPGGGVVQGPCEGLDAEGRLLVRTPQKLFRVVAGHVELL